MKNILILVYSLFVFSNLSPSMTIVKTGNLDLIQEHIDQGDFDIYDLDGYGHNAIHWVVLIGRVDLLILFLNNFGHLNNVINKQDIVGNTPLMTAICIRRWDMIRLLLIYGADLLVRNGFGLNTNELARYLSLIPRDFSLERLIINFSL